MFYKLMANFQKKKYKTNFLVYRILSFSMLSEIFYLAIFFLTSDSESGANGRQKP
jgi:hypothetical protein